MANGAIEFARVNEIDGLDSGDRRARNLVAAHLQAQAGLGEDDQLGAGIESLNIIAGIGLRESAFLSLLQGCVKTGAVGFHLGEDEIAGSVEDALDFIEAVAGQAFLNGDDGRDAAGDGGAEFDALAHLASQFSKIRAALGDQELVGGDDGFAGPQGTANPVAGRLEAADELNDDVGVGGEQIVDVFCPADTIAGPSRLSFCLCCD